MKESKIKKYVLLYGAFIIYSISSVCAKFAAGQDTLFKVLFFMGLEVVSLGVYAIIWQQVLKHFSLVTAMASKGVVVIFNLVWALILFHERISLYNILGTGIIILGIWMVSTDD